MFDLFVFALASWRLASMLVNEIGPFALFERIRRLVGIEEVTVDGIPKAYVARNTLAEGMMCVWCVSVWTAAFFMIGTQILYLGTVVLFGARLLAISGAAIVVHEIVSFLRESR